MCVCVCVCVVSPLLPLDDPRVGIVRAPPRGAAHSRLRLHARPRGGAVGQTLLQGISARSHRQGLILVNGYLKNQIKVIFQLIIYIYNVLFIFVQN